MEQNKDINDLQQKNYKGRLTHGCLALEGGAFRGIYTAGVLDYFLEHNLNLDTVYGVSAGALTAINYVAGNYGRSALLMLEHRNNSHYVGLNAYRESGSVVGFDFMFNDMNKEYPLNEERLFSKRATLCIVVTNVYTGEAEYFSNHDDRETFFKAARASASIPMVSKMVKINNQLYLDGGIATKLPIRKCVADGNDKIVFIGTRDASYRRKINKKETDLARVMYRHYPKFVEAFANANKGYNEDCDYIDELVKEKKIFRITPSKPVTVSRLEKSVKKLSQLYYLGYFDAMAQFDDLLKFLND
ncbi:MAG: patatin family protein [Erysipelotrichaceae bacterium]|nr:patatin family protein [Erysipelotrichaceae bacterium]